MKPLFRRPSWRIELAMTIEQSRRAPFEWGANDCGVGLAAKAVEAMTGVDPAVDFRGQYESAGGAMRLLKEQGFNTLDALVASLLPEIHPSQARNGDIAFIRGDGPIGSLGIFNGDGHILVLRPEGVGVIGHLDADKAFKVG